MAQNLLIWTTQKFNLTAIKQTEFNWRDCKYRDAICAERKGGFIYKVDVGKEEKDVSLCSRFVTEMKRKTGLFELEIKNNITVWMMEEKLVLLFEQPSLSWAERGIIAVTAGSALAIGIYLYKRRKKRLMVESETTGKKTGIATGFS